MRIDLRADDTIVIDPVKTKKRNAIVGMHYCITGKIPGYTRRQFAQVMSTKFKAIMDHNVLSNTNLLIVGTDPGQDKQRNARTYKVQTIPFEKFRDEHLI